MKIPILRIKDILLTSIQVDLTDDDALAFQDNVVRKARDTEAKGLVIDITGLDVVDSFMARVLNDTGAMVHLLGAEVVLCGMQPSVAVTMLEMGLHLTHLATALDLEQGLEKLERLIAERTGGS